MTSQVFFIDLRANGKTSLLDKIQGLVETAGIKKIVKKRSLTAVKLHFGERGNTAFIRPLLVRPIIDSIKAAGGNPFLTDASTLYVGTRGNAVDHLLTAMLNGFSFQALGAPLIIADGIDGRDEVAVPIDLRHFREVYISSAVARADAMVSVAHFKLHEMAGFGGTIKNIGMGSASRRGKMAQHSEVSPQINPSKCIGCGTCRDQCAHGAITLIERPKDLPRSDNQGEKLVRIDPILCVGCAGCIHACPQGALAINFEIDLPKFMEGMVEYTVGTLKGKEKRSLFVNFLTQISPACDCYPFADSPIVPDIGIVASRDPVAIDQVSVDMLNAQPIFESYCLKGIASADKDRIRAVYPKIDWQHQLDYAERLGLGNRAYELIKL